MKVIFTEEAKASLAHIGDFIAEDNPERAYSFTEELRRKALKLAELPRGFPLVPRYSCFRRMYLLSQMPIAS